MQYGRFDDEKREYVITDPRTWDSFKATRSYRGATYQIEVDNADRICRGVGSVRVDDLEIEGNVVPSFGDGRVHDVQVTMEERA